MILPMPIVKKLPVAKEGEIAPGRAKSFRYGFRNGIAYNDNGTLKAYVNFCPHMGGPTDLTSSGVFRCRWHGAEFDPASGDRLCGQAPEGTRLQPIELVVEDGQVLAVWVVPEEDGITA